MPRRYKLDRGAQSRESYLVRYEEELNDEQLEVVTAGNGPLLVVAGAGSGKTRALTYRVARLIEDGVSPAAILLVTFTNKAARAMLDRIDELIPGASRDVWGGTFHSVGNRLLRRHGAVLGYQPNFTILDGEDANTVMDSAISDAGIETLERRFPKGEVLSEIRSWALNTGQEIGQYLIDNFSQFIDLESEIVQVLDRYESRKREANQMDFDDLLVNWIRLLEHDSTANRLKAKFRHVLVDEYQDTNRLQARIVDLMGSVRKNITVVGDDAQSIYSFRGASFENILTFPLRHPETRVARLETNYRSSPQIIELANASIARNRFQFPKELLAVRSEGPLPALVTADDVYEQARFVGQRILELRDEGESLEDVAVLYRSHFQSLELQMELQRRGIPYQVRSGVRFFEQAHIKDVLAHLRITVNPRDEISWKRAMKLYPRVGERTAAAAWSAIARVPDPIGRFAQQARKGNAGLKAFGSILDAISRPALTSQPSEAIRLVVERFYEDHVRSRFSNFSTRLDDLEQLALHAATYDSTSEFLTELSLDSDAIAGEDVAATGPVDEHVTLSSIHQAKGLEWRNVFVIGLNENRFPSARALRVPGGIIRLPESSNQTALAMIDREAQAEKGPKELTIPPEEEERRLFHVAVTRAMQELYLCCVRFERDRGNMAVVTTPSRFLDELPEATYEQWLLE